MRAPERIKKSGFCNRMRGAFIALALGIGLTGAHAMPTAADPIDFVQIQDGKFTLAGKPFVIRGTNYFGSWRSDPTIEGGDGTEHATVWALYHDWNAERLDQDFKFIRQQLHATAVRIGTPSQSDFASMVQYHDYPSWYSPDGTIAEPYKSELIQLANIAYKNGIRIQLCLLWNLSGEIATAPDDFRRDGVMDRLYSKQVQSIAQTLGHHPGILGYSIGNELLVNWPINGTHPSPYEGIAAGFIVRRIHELRAIAPRQLITADELVSGGSQQWYGMGAEFAAIPDVDTGSGIRSVRLADEVDYLGVHFYPEVFRQKDTKDEFVAKINDAKQQLAVSLRAAAVLGKPVAINEFGLDVKPETLAPEIYSSARDRYFDEVLRYGADTGLQGVLAWAAIPEFRLVAGHYQVKSSEINRFSPIEVDLDSANGGQRRVLFYDPQFDLFVWAGDTPDPIPTPAATSVALLWKNIQ